MAGSIFIETLRRNWRQILYWGIGLGALGVITLAIVPNVDVIEQYAGLLETMPTAFLQMFGMGDIERLSTPEGFVNLAFFGRLNLFLAVYAVIAGLNITANEEDDGIMDVTLSLPVPRWRVVIERFLAYFVIIVGIVLLSFVGLWLGLQTTELEVNVGRLFEATLNLIPSLLLIVAITAFAGTLFRRKSMAVAVTTAVIVGSYFIDVIAQAASDTIINDVRVISFFKYYDSEEVIFSGLQWGNVALLAGVTAILVIGALWLFERRDIGL